MGWEVEEILSNENAESVIANVEAEHEAAIRQEKEAVETLSEAVKRIEEANLWKTLLSLDVFAAGSARPEIVEAANKKIRTFARENLENCVGISSKKEQNENVAALPFDSEELQALKILASKVLKRDISKAVLGGYKPKISQISAVQSDTAQSSAKVNTVSAESPAVSQRTEKQKKQLKKAVKPPSSYIPPSKAKQYVPAPQGLAVTYNEVGQTVNMNNLVSSLIAQASGGNVVADSSELRTEFDVNEKF